MNTSPKQKPAPVGEDWLADLERQLAEEFPESQCEAQRAVEGASSERVLDNRFREKVA